MNEWGERGEMGGNEWGTKYIRPLSMNQWENE